MAAILSDIQILRAVAIIMVLIQHFSLSSTFFNSVPGHLSNPFYVGVELFFVISGFVVTRSVCQGDFSPKNFLLRRVFRLYPVLIVFVCFGVAVNQVMRLVNARNQWALDLFTRPFIEYLKESGAILLGTFINYVPSPSNNHGAMWSLSVEFQYYMAIGIILLGLALFRLPSQHRKSVLLCLAIGGVSLSFYGRFLKHFGLSLGWLDYYISWRFDFMAFGALLSFLPVGKTFPLSLRWGRFCLGAALLFPLLALLFCRGGMTGAPEGMDIRDGFVMLSVALAYTLAVALAAQGVLHAWQGTRLYRILLWVGERSFALYLFHFACMALAWRVIVTLHLRIEEMAWPYGISQIIVTMLILLPTVSVVYRFVERPMVAYGKRLTDGR